MINKRITADGVLRAMIAIATCVCGLGAEICGQELAIVSPTGLEATEGNSRGNGPVQPVRVQYLFPASDFAGLPNAPQQIVGLAWRPDATTGPTTTSADRFTLSLSTSTAVDELSLTFAENVGPDETLVFDDVLTVSTLAGTQPRGFDFRVDFQTPFAYDPTQGNLLVDLWTTGFDLGQWWVDNQTFEGDHRLLVQTFQSGNSDSPFADGSFNALAVLEFIFASDAVSGVIGDYDSSGQVEQTDLDLVLLNWGVELADPSSAGWTNDLPLGPIDQEELDKVLLKWGNTVSAASTTSIPEPSALPIAFVVMCLAYCLCRRAAPPRVHRAARDMYSMSSKTGGPSAFRGRGSTVE